jgi:hypothetical protein
MKKTVPLVSLVIFLSFCLVSCGRREAAKQSAAIQTLEERYPGWANLTWISTDDIPRGFPRMEISIRENLVTMTQYTSDTDFVSREFTMMYLLGNTLTLEDKNKGRLNAFFWQTDSTVMIKTKGIVEDYLLNPHTYALRKNKTIQPE